MNLRGELIYRYYVETREEECEYTFRKLIDMEFTRLVKLVIGN